MTTSILSPENSALTPSETEVRVAPRYTSYRIRHTLASRFAFLLICLAIIMSALAYGTVHAWALATFFIGAVMLLILWMVDSWTLGSLRISQNIYNSR